MYYDKNWSGYLYSASDVDSIRDWFNHFAQFPLKSHKNIDLVRFKRVLFFKQKKYHLSTNEKYRERFYTLLNHFKDR